MPVAHARKTVMAVGNYLEMSCTWTRPGINRLKTGHAFRDHGDGITVHIVCRSHLDVKLKNARLTSNLTASLEARRMAAQDVYEE